MGAVTPPARRFSGRRFRLEPPDTPLAWRGGRAWIVLLTVIAISLFTDLASKSWSFRTIAPTPVRGRADTAILSGLCRLRGERSSVFCL